MVLVYWLLPYELEQINRGKISVSQWKKWRVAGTSVVVV